MGTNIDHGGPGMTVHDADRYAEAFDRAADIYIERSAQRGQHWRKHDWPDHIKMLQAKASRLEHSREMRDVPNQGDLDEALDIINYGNFVYQKMMDIIADDMESNE